MSRVALVTAYNGQGQLLVGKRNDNERYTLPGGHLNDGEDPRAGARRELFEETGLHAQSLSFLKHYVLPNGSELHCFSAFVTGEPHGNHDPDREVSEWEWIDVEDGLPPKVYDHLHGPDGDDNIVKQLFDLKKAEIPAISLSKALDDEVYRLLDHPNPAERTLALKLDTATPAHVLHAALDPDPTVYSAAMDDPRFGPSEAQLLMEASADRSGAYPAGAKSALLLRNGLLKPYHLAAYVRAARAAGPDQYLSAVESAAAHPLADDGLLRSMYLDPNVIRDPRAAILKHPNAPADILESALTTALSIPSPDTGALAEMAVAHPRMLGPALSGLVHRAADRGEEHVLPIAARALEANTVPDEAYQYLLKQATVKPGGPAPALLGALLRGPSGNPQRAAEVSRALPAGTMGHLLGSAHLAPEDLDQIVAHAHATKDPDLLRKVMDHPSFGSRHLALLVKAAEDDLAKLPGMDPQKLASHPVIHAQLGFDPSTHPAFKAARFLAGNATITPEAERAALRAEDGDPERASLLAYGIPHNEANLRALRSIVDMKELRKDETDPQPHASTCVAAHPEGDEVAQAISRAFRDKFVFFVALGGKHSKGSMVAFDEQTKTTWLLKSGSGGAGGAAGADQDPSNPNAREAAFYHIARQWGIADHYPRAELVLLDDKPYAALRLLPTNYRKLDKTERKEPGSARKYLAPYLYDGLLHKWAAIDYVLGNPDSHGQNVMVDPKGDVKLIDHGSAFAGLAFDPANDNNSFTPYYLRAWAITDNFHAMSSADRLRALPRVPSTVEKQLRDWLSLDVSTENLRLLCARYGINPEPTLARLAKLKQLVAAGTPTDLAINQLWVST